MSIQLAVGLKLLKTIWPYVLKLLPRTGVKEASVYTIVVLAQPLYAQYAAGGVEAMDAQAIGALVAVAWVLIIRLVQKVRG